MHSITGLLWAGLIFRLYKPLRASFRPETSWVTAGTGRFYVALLSALEQTHCARM